MAQRIARPPAPGRASAGARRMWFSFFDRSIEVVAEDEVILETLGAVYARQRVAPPPEPLRADVTVRVRSAAADCGDGAGGRAARIEVGGRTLRVPAPDRVAHYAHLAMLNAAAAAAQDAVVLHAGAVARGGRAALLLGRSGSGKSTLTVELVRRGCGFLTDDFAVVGTDGVVTPFPRRVNLTDASLALLGLSPPPDAPRLPGDAGETKTMIDADELVPGCLSGPTPAAVLVLLGPPPAAGSPGGPHGSTWRVEFDRAPAELLDALAELPEASAIRRDGAHDRVVAIDTPSGGRLVRALDALCARLDVTILAARREAAAGATTTAPRMPRRTGPPIVTPLGIAEAHAEAMGHALSLSGARFYGRTEAADLLEAVAAIRAALSGVERAVRIEPGELGATADAVEALL